MKQILSKEPRASVLSPSRTLKSEVSDPMTAETTLVLDEQPEEEVAFGDMPDEQIYSALSVDPDEDDEDEDEVDDEEEEDDDPEEDDDNDDDDIIEEEDDEDDITEVDEDEELEEEE